MSRGDIVRDDGEVYEVIFDGAHRGQDLDLFRKVDEAPKPTGDEPAQIRRSEANAAVMALMRGHRGYWQTSRLREEAGLTPAEFELALNRLRKSGTIVSVSRGVVQLRRGAVAEPEAA